MEVYYYPSFLRQIKKLPKSVRESAIKRTKLFIADPHDPLLDLHKLSGTLKDYQAFSVDYSFRILLEIKKNKAYFHTIGNHDIYR